MLIYILVLLVSIFVMYYLNKEINRLQKAGKTINTFGIVVFIVLLVLAIWSASVVVPSGWNWAKDQTTGIFAEKASNLERHGMMLELERAGIETGSIEYWQLDLLILSFKKDNVNINNDFGYGEFTYFYRKLTMSQKTFDALMIERKKNK